MRFNDYISDIVTEINASIANEKYQFPAIDVEDPKAPNATLKGATAALSTLLKCIDRINTIKKGDSYLDGISIEDSHECIEVPYWFVDVIQPIRVSLDTTNKICADFKLCEKNETNYKFKKDTFERACETVASGLHKGFDRWQMVKLSTLLKEKSLNDVYLTMSSGGKVFDDNDYTSLPIAVTDHASNLVHNTRLNMDECDYIKQYIHKVIIRDMIKERGSVGSKFNDLGSKEEK